MPKASKLRVKLAIDLVLAYSAAKGVRPVDSDYSIEMAIQDAQQLIDALLAAGWVTP